MTSLSYTTQSFRFHPEFVTALVVIEKRPFCEKHGQPRTCEENLHFGTECRRRSSNTARRSAARSTHRERERFLSADTLRVHDRSPVLRKVPVRCAVAAHLGSN